MSAYKILTHDYCPPLQGGDPIWDGVTLPFTLPKTKLDKSERSCGAGWNYVADLATGFRIAGLWRDGRPAACFVVEPSSDWIKRGDKRRCSELTLVRRCTSDEIQAGIWDLSEPFGQHQERMARSQWGWYNALGRPRRSEAKVETGLRSALERRGLGDWTLRRFWTAQDAWHAWGAWEWAPWATRAAWAAWAAWDTLHAWGAWEWAPWAARDALSVEYASLMGWVEYPPDHLTRGIRTAYRHGLELVVPSGPNELGWVMA